MTPREAHLWAIGYDDAVQAERTRAEITALAGARQSLFLLDPAILARTTDGSYTLNREPFPLTLSAPIMTGAAIGALLGTSASTVANAVGIEEAFIREVERLMKPGVSALLVLDEQGDLDATLCAIRGLGGTVLKTNVDLKRAKLVQSTLSTEPAAVNPIPNGDPK
jgi:uncharacterized membrane protein